MGSCGEQESEDKENIRFLAWRQEKDHGFRENKRNPKLANCNKAGRDKKFSVRQCNANIKTQRNKELNVKKKKGS